MISDLPESMFSCSRYYKSDTRIKPEATIFYIVYSGSYGVNTRHFLFIILLIDPILSRLVVGMVFVQHS
jgi:hypothetical protein